MPRKLYTPKSKEPFKLSRTGIDEFTNCPRCFYMRWRLGVSKPGGPPFLLNSAVDELLKREFDLHRAKNKAHPMCEAYGLDLVPFSHKDIDIWRSNFRGIQHLHEPTNFLVYGAPDDVWQDTEDTLYVVDYKATAKKESATKADELWPGFLKQVEVYQWLFRRNGFTVSDTAYFVNCNGDKAAPSFDGRLEFDVKIIPYKGSDEWVEKAIKGAKECLASDNIPEYSPDCDYCNYQQEVSRL